MLRKSKSQGAGEPTKSYEGILLLCEFAVPWGGKQKAAEGAYRSARHIDAERTAAVMNVPNDVRRREGKRACSPAKEL